MKHTNNTESSTDFRIDLNQLVIVHSQCLIREMKGKEGKESVVRWISSKGKAK